MLLNTCLCKTVFYNILAINSDGVVYDPDNSSFKKMLNAGTLARWDSQCGVDYIVYILHESLHTFGAKLIWDNLSIDDHSLPECVAAHKQIHVNTMGSSFPSFQNVRHI